MAAFFIDGEGIPLVAVIPFQVVLRGSAGAVFYSFFPLKYKDMVNTQLNRFSMLRLIH